MKKMLAMFLAAFFALVGIAAAQDVESKIQSIDRDKKEMVLEDGTTLAWDEDTAMTMEGQWAKLEGIKVGAKVKASYEEKGGKKVAVNIEFSD